MGPGPVGLYDLERRLREAVAAIRAEARPLLLEILTADEDRRAQEIGHLHVAGVTPATVAMASELGGPDLGFDSTDAHSE